MSSGPVSLEPNTATGGRGHAEVDKARLPKPTRVKNKAPAPTQITAEQILREAREQQESEGGAKVPKQNITDPEELAEYRLAKRKEFEDVLRRNRTAIGVWVKYAKWEESQQDFPRARSVYERALDVEYQNHSLWLKYAEMEMRHKQINHARNIWDRATALLPREEAVQRTVLAVLQAATSSHSLRCVPRVGTHCCCRRHRPRRRRRPRAGLPGAAEARGGRR